MDVGTLTIAGVAVMPLILALVEMAKRFGLTTDYAPVVAIGLGIALVSLTQGFTVDAIVTGLIVGLSASGLWSASPSFGRMLKR
jgi:hypothetical protein